MPLLLEGKYLGDWLKFEEENLYSRQQVTILAGAGVDRVLQSGTVLGTITASGKVVGLNTAAVDGSQTASGILMFNTTALNGVDKQSVAIARLAIVNKATVVWPAGITGGQIITALGQLTALGILSREGA